MSKIETALQLIWKPKRCVEVILEKFSILVHRVKVQSISYLKVSNNFVQDLLNQILRKDQRLRISKKEGTVILVSPYIGVPQMMAVTNYINCWLEGFRANRYDALFVVPSQNEQPTNLPDNLKGSILIAPYKKPNFSFDSVIETEHPSFALFHNSPPSVECAYSCSLIKSKKYLFVGDAMSRRFENPLERRNYIDKVIEGFGGIIAVSDYIKREWVSYGFDVEKIFVARTPVSAEKWPQHFGSSSHVEAGYFGNIYHKEIDNLLEIAQAVSEEIPGFKVSIYGDGFLEDREKLQKKIIDKRLSKIVYLCEGVTIEKMRIIQSKMDVLLLPREKGEFSDAGFPNKIGEYLASGCPAVCTDVGEISQILTPGKHIRMVQPGDNKLFAKEVINCLNNREESLKIAQRGKGFIKSYASPKIVTGAFLEWRENAAQCAKI